MDEEPEEYCNNCKKNVVASNFATHSAFCQRHIFVCNVCDEPVPRNSVKEHEEEYHRPVICDLCYIAVEKWELPKHQEVCPKRRVTCEFCEGEIIIDESKDHFEFCGSRTERCSFCSKYIMLKDKKTHSEYHLYKEEFHRRKGAEEIDQNIRNEMINKTSSKQISPKQRVICEFCEEEITSDEAEDHFQFCGTRTEKCSFCSKVIMLRDKKEHSEHHLYKEELFRRNGKGEVDQNIRNEVISKTSVKFSEDKQSELCPFCNEIFFSAAIYKHMESCPKHYFQCDLCCEKVLTKNKDKHLSSQCKMLQERIPSDLYECPLCGEQLLEKEKFSHESFSCKALLQNEDGPLYSLRDEKNATEYTEEMQKNSVETCMTCKKKIPMNELFNHKHSCNKSSKKVCAYCDKELYGDASEAKHLKICEVYKQISKIHDDNERDFDYKGAKPKHSKFSEIVKPKVAKCTYCKTTLNDNILLFHEQECVHQPIKCPDCSVTVLLKDIEKHFCKLTKGRGVLGRGRRRIENEKNESRSFISTFTNMFSSSKSNPKTYDEYENDRNQVYEDHMEKRYAANADKYEDLYFVQQSLMDEPKIPCEFCDKLFPSSEIVLHMTGCNPEAASLPQPNSSKGHPTENSASSRQLKRSFNSTSSSTNSSAGREVAHPNYESVQKRFQQKSNVNPDEYLTGCNPTEVSLPQPNSSKDLPTENSASSSQLKRSFNSTISSPNSSAGRGISVASSNYESIQKRLQQKSNARPGEYLTSYDSETSSDLKISHSGYQNVSEGNNLSSTMTSVWNNEPSDVEMEETGSETNSKNMTENVQEVVKEHSERSESGKHSVDSDDEMSSILEYIEGKTAESTHYSSSTLDETNMQSKIHISEETFGDMKKKQIAYNASEAVSTLEESKKMELSNFRFCSNTMKSSYGTRKLQNSQIEDYDIYYKTNALGYVIEDGESKICKPRKKDTDASQNSVLGSKYEDHNNVIQTKENLKNEDGIQTTNFLSDDSVKRICKSKFGNPDDENDAETNLDKRNECRTQVTAPCMPHKALEVVKSKYECQNDSYIDSRLEERFKSRTVDVSLPEKLVSKSKFKYFDDDDDIEESQHKEFMRKTQNVSPVMHETSKNIVTSEYNYQYGNTIQASQIEEVQSKTQDISSPVCETTKQPSKYFTVCPMCKETIKWIDLNLHLPACATNSGRCARCGIKVPSSDMKEHVLVKCSKIHQKDCVNETNQRTPKLSYEQVFQSLTLSENSGERKSRFEGRSERRFENAIVKTSDKDKIECVGSNISTDRSPSEQAFKIEPAVNYWYPAMKNRKNISSFENTREEEMKEVDASPESLSSDAEKLKKWQKWNKKYSGDS